MTGPLGALMLAFVAMLAVVDLGLMFNIGPLAH